MLSKIKYIKIFKFIFLLFYCLTYCNIALSNYFDEKYKKAGMLIDENYYKKAILLYEEILKDNHEIDSYKKSRIFNNIGYCYYKLNEVEKASNFYKKALDVDENFVVCLNNVAAVLMNQRKYKEALPRLTKAYQLDNCNIKVIFNLFVVNYYLKNKEDALNYIEEAFNVNENYTMKRLRKKNISTNDIKKLRKHLKNNKKKGEIL